MNKKTRNKINNISVPSFQISPSIDKIKLKPIKCFNKRALLTNYPNESEKNSIRKEISTSLFQDNDVNMVRNLNLDEEKNFCANLLYKGKLEKNILNEEEYLSASDKGFNLPKIKSITMNNIVESEKKMNENQKISLRNMANNQLEKELYDKLKNVKIKLKNFKNQKYELYKDFEIKTKQIKEINLEIEALQAGQGETFLNKIFDLKTSSPHSRKESGKKSPNKLQDTPKRLRKEESLKINPEKKPSNSPKKIIKNLWGKSKYEEKIQRIKMLYLAKKDNDDKKMEKYRQVKQIKEDLKQIDMDINEINKKLLDLKSQENESINKLMRHYEALLYRGKDTRNDGLIWIIKAMWKLGKNVPMQFIPTFLDFNAIEFLFKLANKSIELENKKKLLNDNKKKLNIQIHKQYFINNNNNTDINNFSKQSKNRRSSLLFKTNLIKKNSILKRSVSQANIVKTYIHSSVDDEQRDQEMNTFKEISKLVENKENMEIEKMPGMNDIETLQKKIKSIENEIVELKNKEIIRIFKEFIENDYQNKYRVSIDVVLAALLGEHMKNIEVNKFSKFKKEYYENLKNIRFYEYGKKNDSK